VFESPKRNHPVLLSEIERGRWSRLRIYRLIPGLCRAGSIMEGPESSLHAVLMLHGAPNDGRVIALIGVSAMADLADIDSIAEHMHEADRTASWGDRFTLD
jgi:hypothetical protein